MLPPDQARRAVARAIPRDPGDIDGLTVWLEADRGVVLDASGNVAEWRDQSGRGNHAVQGTGAARPTYAVVSGRPAVQTTAAARFMTIPSSADLSVSPTLGGSVYVVYDSTYVGANGFIVARWPVTVDSNREWLIGVNNGATNVGGAYMRETGTGTERSVTIAEDCSTGAVRVLRLRYDPSGPSIRAQAGGTAYGPTAIAAIESGGNGSVCIGRIYPTDASFGIGANVRGLMIFRRDIPTAEDVFIRDYLLRRWGAA
jgi:hypothetical protein